MARVYVSIGSNIEPLRHIRAGLAEMQRHYGTLTSSSVYESQAVGFKGENFYNLVVAFDTDMTVHTVARTLRLIENHNGRQRLVNKFSARTLDLDLLLYDDLILKDNEVDIPRGEIMKYSFVLWPLAEIAPDIKHPVMGQCYADLWQDFDKIGQDLWRVEVSVVGLGPSPASDK